MHSTIPISTLPYTLLRQIRALRGAWSETSLNGIRDIDSHRALAACHSYGRHRGPCPKLNHAAAVMISLMPHPEYEWAIPLTLRPTQMQDHAGQVSLPGGRADAFESAWQTALREMNEELGCPVESIQAIGQLRSIYVYASRHMVTPVLGFCDSLPTFSPNAEEVAELLFMPLSELLSENAIVVGTLRKGTTQFEAPGFRIGTHFVWGATGMLLGEVRQYLLTALD